MNYFSPIRTKGPREFNKMYAVMQRAVLIFPYTMLSISGPKSPYGLLDEDEL
jgi:hypothetical protein